MERGKLLAIISVILFLLLSILVLNTISPIAIIFIFSAIIILSFFNLFKEEKGWPRTIAKIILFIPIILIILASIIGLFMLLDKSVKSFWYSLLIIPVAISTLLGYWILKFDKNASSNLKKILLLILGLIIYGIVIYLVSAMVGLSLYGL